MLTKWLFAQFASVPEALHCLAGMAVALLVAASILAMILLPAGMIPLIMGLTVICIIIWLVLVTALPRPPVVHVSQW